jgi:hypothetical protein
MELANVIQMVSLGVLVCAGAVVLLDFVKAKQEFSKVFTAWLAEREEA